MREVRLANESGEVSLNAANDGCANQLKTGETLRGKSQKREDFSRTLS